MTPLEKRYIIQLAEPSDMRVHMPALRQLASGRRVVEFGTRRGTSSWAILAGHPVSFTTYDIQRWNDVDDLEAAAKAEGIPFRFVQEDIDKLPEIEACDFVFIDAMHNGNSVAIQLRLAECAGAQWIALHDTEIFGRSGDLPGTPGILDAVDAFIATYRSWKIRSHTQESYGFTVLSKLP